MTVVVAVMANNLVRMELVGSKLASVEPAVKAATFVETAAPSMEAAATEAPTSVEATATATAPTTSADLDDRRVVSSGR